jgi:hypothetical protein
MNNNLLKLSRYSAEAIKRQKIKLSVLIFLLTVLVASGFFILDGLTPGQIVLALTGTYNKGTGDTLTTTDWNMLDDDFVARSGGAASNMTGILDMNNNRIANLLTPATGAGTDAANRSYVDTQIAAAGNGGDTFVNWGQSNCPAGTNRLYYGYAFHQKWDLSGGGEPVCIEYGVDSSPAMSSASITEDALSPLATANAGQLPPNIPPKRAIKCALCYRPNGICFEHWGGQSCGGAAGFSAVYAGYGMGGFANRTTNVNRHCVDNSANFDGSTLLTGPSEASWYGTNIYTNTGVGLYTLNSYVKCSVCCN